MGRVVLTASATVALMALATPAVARALGSPRLTAADRTEIGILVDRFVKDAVRRENLAAAWSLTGPGLRGGTTRSAWNAGTGVTVAYYPARGTSFRTAWTGRLVAPGHAVLALSLHPDAAHPRVDEVAMTVDVRKRGNRWVVNELYQAASFGKNGTVTGPRDFGALGAAGTPASGPRRVRSGWLIAALGTVGALVVATPLLFIARATTRARRARRAYESAFTNRS